jgi:hypothetical protein
MAPVIQLTQGQETHVSQEDYAFLSKWKWHAVDGRRGRFYAARNRRVNESGGSQICVHRLVATRMGLDTSHCVDHIDGNSLNNTRSNLRAATKAQNGYNRGKSKNNKSGIKGISWDKSRSKWAVQIRADGTTRNLGRFDTKEDAAEAYRKAVKKYHKEFAHA